MGQQILPGELTSQSSTPLFEVGTEYIDEFGRHYVYGTYNGTTSAGGISHYVPGTWDFTPTTTTLGGTEGTNWKTVGWACCDGTDNYYGWFFVGPGHFEALVANAFAAAEEIYTTAAAGIIGADSSSLKVDCAKNVDKGVTSTRVTIFVAKYPATIGAGAVMVAD